MNFLLMLIGHAFGDFAMQNDFVAKFKSPLSPRIGDCIVWPYVLVSHALIHAGFVWMVTHSMAACIGELVAHSLIDVAKCMGLLNFHQDQWLHVVCKVLWCFL